MTNGPEETITVQFTRAQAFVLLDWLSTYTDAEDTRVPFADPSERTVLWVLEGKLETQLTDIFAPDYTDRLEAARAAVRGDGAN